MVTIQSRINNTEGCEIMMDSEINLDHYLKRELYDLIKTDSEIFQFIQDQLLDGIWYWDLENPEHEWMSPGFWQLFGLDPDKMPHSASSWQNIIDPSDLKTVVQNFEKHCIDPNHKYDQVVRYRHADGGTVWVRCKGMAIRNAQGKPIRMLGLHTDITELKQLELKQQQNVLQLKMLNNELQDVIYAITHDLQEPLRAVISFSNFLKLDIGDNLPEKADKDLQYIEKAAKRLSMLISGLHQYSKASQAEYKLEEFSLTQCFNIAVSNLQRLIKTHQATVSIQELPIIEADFSTLLKAFTHLLSNAILFKSEQAPVIEVSSSECADNDKMITIHIKDNGIGIDEKHYKRIFNLFQTLQSADESKNDGVGVGLSIVKKVIERHQGTISVESKLGQGSIFHINLPKSQLDAITMNLTTVMKN